MCISAIVVRQLDDLGIEVQTGVGRTGVLGLLGTERQGPTELLRLDMDAFPIQEENETEYVSSRAGVMHACDHDEHTAIGLAVARDDGTSTRSSAGCAQIRISTY